MKWNVERAAIAGVLVLAFSGQGVALAKDKRPPEGRGALPAANITGVSDAPVTLGEPFKVGDVTYRPEDRADYDDVGYATAYVEPPQGNATANGEAFNPNAITAAHRTLPLPSYVEVTSLETGRTILVRVNDRGPFSNDRLIDLSDGAARQLGIAGARRTPVRVRRVNPPQQERAVLRQGGSAAERLESPVMMLTALRRKLGITPTPPMAVAATAPKPPNPAPTAIASAPIPPSAVEQAEPAPKLAVTNEGLAADVVATSRPANKSSTPAIIAGGKWFVQLGAFSNKPRAEALAKRAGARVDAVGSLFRVRFGPFANEAAANESLRSIKAKGYPEARILSGG